jgi:FlaA1/EpsC-like NDP-sugar epimerase
VNILKIIGRTNYLFEDDLKRHEAEIDHLVRTNRFLVIGGAGSIGQAVTKELFARSAKLLHVVDLSENYLVELVRDIRSQLGYATENFDTFAIDCGAKNFQDFMALGKYDYVFNLSAMKHVRSENSAFSMLRMLEVNLFNAISTYKLAEVNSAKKYFCVSTDKAANPVNFMGATKRAMEISLMRNKSGLEVSGARFANVAFSNGSLLQGFENRIHKRQPLSTPCDIKRFFVTPKESGVICLFSALLGEKNEILFPYNDYEMRLKSFLEIAKNYLEYKGKQGVECSTEQEAREFIMTGDLEKYWPINVFKTDTAGEKPFEEFVTDKEDIIYNRFTDLASVKFSSDISDKFISDLRNKIDDVDPIKPDARDRFLNIMSEFVPTFSYLKANKFLNAKM